MAQNDISMTDMSLMPGTYTAARIILVTSCKGGVGKSTCAANLAAAFALRGKKTLLCDCDFDMRCLDLMLGVENDVVYDLYDAATGRAPLSKALIRDERCGNLYLLAAPYSGGDTLTPEMIAAVFGAASADGFEYIIVDTPGTLVPKSVLLTGMARGAVIVASHQPVSIRAADRTAEYLSGYRVPELRLLINEFDVDAAIHGTRPGINEIIDRTSIQLGGIVPYDRRLMLTCEAGELCAFDPKLGNAAAAFDNIAARLSGRYAPLFSGFRGYGVRRRIKKLLGGI